MASRFALLRSRIALRLLLFNSLLVFLPAGGFLYLDVFESQLLEEQERSMVQQARILAAALGGHGPLTATATGDLLRRLQRRSEARLRVVDPSGALLADSSTFGPQLPDAKSDPRLGLHTYLPGATSVLRGLRGGPFAPPADARSNRLYRGGAAVYRLYRWLFLPPEPAQGGEGFYSPGQPLLGREIRAALAGRYGAATRATQGGQRSLTLYSAVPVWSAGTVVGAALVSQSTLRLLNALYEVRLGILRVVLLSVAAAAVLSLFAATTVVRPLRQLRDEASELLDRRGRLRGSFRGSARRDEIGDLTRALTELTRRLERHLRFLEAFAADVSHELRNPLAGIRTATELLAEVDAPADRARFLGLVEREVARMERLLTGVRDITVLDARLDQESTTRVDLAALARDVVDSFRLRAERESRPVTFVLDARAPLYVRATPERLTQVCENLLDNAVGFSPPGGVVTVTVSPVLGDHGATVASLVVEDQGPGIPEAHLARLFDRFFSYRPARCEEESEGQGNEKKHTGLGLAIVQAIVEGYGGTVSAANGAAGGGRLEVRMPSRQSTFELHRSPSSS